MRVQYVHCGFVFMHSKQAALNIMWSALYTVMFDVIFHFQPSEWLSSQPLIFLWWGTPSWGLHSPVSSTA